jgi:spermidine/putrescine transport system substrate-binding protein
MREVFGAAFLWKGKSINSSKPEDVNFAQTLLKKVKSEEVIFSSEPRALIERGEIDIAHIYSSDGIQASANNPKIKFFIPKEGATIYTDNFAIPKTSTRTKEALAFINFFLDPEVAARLAVENLLATPNQTVKQKLPPEAIHGPFHYPGSEIMKRLYFLFDIGESLPVMSRAWTELKSS